MFRLLVLLAAVCSFASAQKINFDFTTGTRSLWIPFKTVTGVPFASVLDRSDNNQTTYVVSCPTGEPQCAFAPNLTVTEGTAMVKYVSSTSGATSGTVEISCELTASPVNCIQEAHGGGNIQKTSGTVPATSIVYSAFNVTALKSKTTGDTTDPDTVTVTQTPSTTSTPNGVMATITAGPLALGAAVGAGLLALGAL